MRTELHAPLRPTRLPNDRSDGKPRLTGDDKDYRLAVFDPRDAEDPDPVVRMNGVIACYPVYAFGALKGVTSEYGTGIGAPPIMHLRRPVANKVIRTNARLADMNRAILGIDFFRSAETQRQLWLYLLRMISSGRDISTFNINDLLTLGLLADDVGSYSVVIKNDEFEARLAKVRSDEWEAVMQTAELLSSDRGLSAEELAELLVHFRANIDGSIPLDETSPLNHGSGAAADMIAIDLLTGKPCFYGTPFDGPSSFMPMRAFEERSIEEYQEEAAKNKIVRTYLQEHGIDPDNVTEVHFNQARDERRILANAVMADGGEYFDGEYWHFVWDDSGGGKYRTGTGNGSMAVFRNVRNTDGQYVAIFNNQVTHRLVRADLGG